MQVSQEFQSMSKKMLWVPNILLFALIVSIFLYLVIGYMVAEQGGKGGEFDRSAFEVIRNALTVVSGVTVVGTIALRLFLFGDERLSKSLKKLYQGLESGTLPPLQFQSHDPGFAKRFEKLSLKEQTIYRIFGRAFVSFVLIIALHETIAIYGLILTLLTYQFMKMVPFAAVALVLNFSMIGFISRIINRSIELVGHRRFEEDYR